MHYFTILYTVLKYWYRPFLKFTLRNFGKNEERMARNRFIFSSAHCKKVCDSLEPMLYIGEYSGISSLKLKNSGI
jgi:hypothetical protein